MSNVSSVFIEQKHILPDKFSSVMFQILIYCFVHKLDLSKGEMSALAYFYLNEVTEETEELILTKGIFTNRQSIKNFKSKLCKLNIISKKNKSYVINNFMNVAVGDKIAILIKAGNR